MIVRGNNYGCISLSHMARVYLTALYVYGTMYPKYVFVQTHRPELLSNTDIVSDGHTRSLNQTQTLNGRRLELFKASTSDHWQWSFLPNHVHLLFKQAFYRALKSYKFDMRFRQNAKAIFNFDAFIVPTPHGSFMEVYIHRQNCLYLRKQVHIYCTSQVYMCQLLK